MTLRGRILYDARILPMTCILVERTSMPETSDQRLEVWVVHGERWESGRWAERLDEALLLLAGHHQDETPVVARWALWEVIPLALRLVEARDKFVAACRRARSVKPDGQA